MSLLKARRRMSPVVALAAASLVAQLPLFQRSIVSLDEGQLTAIGHRLSQGQILYRDVYTGIFPGIYWLAEALFRLFGTDVLLLRIAQMGMNTAIAVLLFLLAKRLGCGRAAWAPPLGFYGLMVLSFPVYTMLTYSSASLACALLAVLFACRFVESARTIDGVVIGVSLALCTIFKQNFGVFTLLPVFASLLWARPLGALATASVVRTLAVPALSGLAIAVLAAARLWTSGAWPAFIEATGLTLMANQMETFNQPLPPLFGAHPLAEGTFLFLYGPSGMFGSMLQGDAWASPRIVSMLVRIGYGSAYLALAATPWLLFRLGRETNARVHATGRVVLPCSALFFLGIFPSAIWSHLAAVYPPLLIVLAVVAVTISEMLTRNWQRMGDGLRVVAWTMVGVGLAFCVRLERQLSVSFPNAFDLPHASLRVGERELALYQAANKFLLQCAEDGEPVLVLPDMPLLYVTSGRLNPTPYDLIIPGDVRETDILERMRATNVRCVVFNPHMYVQFSEFEKLFPGLSSYLKKEFDRVGAVVVGQTEWHFLRRKGESW